MAAHHHHGHGHRHDHAGEAGDRRVFLAIVVNLLLTLAQVVGGLLAGSLALVADALHNFSDAISLIIAFAARKIARRPSNADMTFGYGRVEIVAALVNYTTLILIGIYLCYEAVIRFFEPQSIDGWLVIWIAGLALAIDIVTALLTYALAKESSNMRAAFLHNVADALGSVGVIVAGTLILLYDWRLADPLVTLLIAAYVLWMSFKGIGPVIRILMLGSPPDIATEKVVAALRSVPGIADVHHIHFWQMDEAVSAVDAHLVIEGASWDKAESIKARAKMLLGTDFGIGHATLETERVGTACADEQTVGHAAAAVKGRHLSH